MHIKNSSSITIPYAWLVIAALFLFRAQHPAASGSIDPDVYWHVLYGHWIIDHLSLPTVDMWSWTMPGKEYRLTQWLGEVAIGLAERLGGEAGMQFLSAFLTVSAITFSYKAALVFLKNRTAAILVALIGCMILVSTTCRPHQFSFVGIAALTWIIAVFTTTGRKAPLFVIPLIMTLWVNFHGGFVVGLLYLWLMAGTYAVGAFADKEFANRREEIVALVITAIAGTVATLVHPYGYGVWLNTIAVGTLKSVSSGITEEWIPTSIRTETGLSYLTTMLATIMAVAYSRARPAIAEGLMFIALIFLGWWATRLSIVAGILMVPLLAKYAKDTALFELAFEGKDRVERGLPITGAALAIAAAIGLGYAAGTTDRATAKRVHDSFPVEETAFMKANNLEGRIINTMEAGGYLIANWKRPVFIDTRLDLYGDEFFFDFMRASAGGDNWREFVAKWDPDFLLLEHNMALTQLLLQTGLYEVVFKGPRYAIIKKIRLEPT